MSKELSEIKELISFMENLENEVESLEQQLKDKKEHLELFKNDIIPEYIIGLGLSELKLDDGRKIEIKTSYFGNISDARSESAFKWLRDNGYHTKIKTGIALSFGAGMEEILDCAVLRNFLKEKDIPFNMKEGVHPQTLKSTIRECMEKGINFPQELFGVFIALETVVEKPKTT